MKKKHIYVLIIFIVLTILIAGIWKIAIQINLDKYNLTDKKIAEYQEKVKGMVKNPTDELIQDMTESYKVAAQKEYENLAKDQISIFNIILISIGISAATCVVIEGVWYFINKKKK